MSEPEEKAPVCYLCQCAIPKPTEDYFCSGCDQYICDQHLADPWGTHEPEDHDD